MKLVTYRKHVEAEARLGALVDGLVVDIEMLGAAGGAVLPVRMLDFIAAGPAALRAAQRLLEAGIDSWPVPGVLPAENVTLLAPIPRPAKNIFGIGLNYVEHVEESARTLDTSRDLPKQPVIFSKPPTAVIGPGEPVRHNGALTRQLDWEVELAAIVGTRAQRVSKDAAMSHVFGYSVMIDISARDNRRSGQWIVSKGQDTFAPFGPCIVTADEIGDPQELDLWLTVNGVEKQRSNTRHMLFRIDTLVSDISSCMTLEPGDIIATGTPEGVGAGRDPQEWLWPGDEIECGVQGIGTLRHSVIRA
ncbi:fumarylacetoacetate hydrolase family protein [Paroceanicella profunda]|uniref:Fumarylacetoacetate hydrolase family protein n=1 Tax=Paroceanicella profunda TaxID=2579971 RepID=A0A5B8FVU5_9RHOB|nr:fumarylacetoacetate hydrolase family protein [Paroceanicella profunda]QDL91290.1 fumarylacetoacetate hydrolase family protein [Paroceanicella profunda]